MRCSGGMITTAGARSRIVARGMQAELWSDKTRHFIQSAETRVEVQAVTPEKTRTEEPRMC